MQRDNAVRPQSKPGRASSPPPHLLAWLFAPFGLIVFAYGTIIVVTREVTGRSGGTLRLSELEAWVFGGLFVLLGLSICLSPLYYTLRRKRRSAAPPDPDGASTD